MMLTHPTINQLRELKLDGMADAFTELQTQDRAKDLGHAEWLALLLDREAASRNHQACPQPAQGGPVAPRPSVDRRRRLSHAAPARQGAVPATRHLPLDRRASQSARHRPMRDRQVVASLRAGTEGLPRWLQRALCPRAAAVRGPRAGARRRPLPTALPNAHQGRPADPRRLGPRSPQLATNAAT